MQIPPYKLLYEQLRSLITDGHYRSGSMLPSENELAATYGLARPTVRKALEQLVSDGFIIKRQGKGSIVRSTQKGIGILSISGTTSAVGKENIRTSIVLRPEKREWSEAFGFELTQTEQAAGCLYFERVRYVGGTAVFLDYTMLPDSGLMQFRQIDLENASLFDTLRTRYAISVTGGTQRLFAIRADRRMSTLLGVRQGSPILQLNRRIDTSRCDFHIYSQLFCVTSQYSISGSF